ncbi:MAG: peptidoglycan DD-metalloendopeptidase family protein [Alteromonadaceae bacterium]|nr:peptidoglycan DD-metalloendopeptidase family protein [Alteromonadaceae bacterium]
MLSFKKTKIVRNCLMGISLASAISCAFGVSASSLEHKSSLEQAQNDKQENQTNSKLNNVQKAITAQQQTIANTNKKRAKLEARLKSDELAIAAVAKKVNQTNNNLSSTKNKISTLKQQKTKLLKQKQHQQELLAQQLRAAYSNGDHDYLKLILNQEKPASIQRTLTYYQYFNKARIDEIKQFEQTVENLAAVVKKQQIQADKLVELKQQQLAQQAELKKSNEARKSTIKQLNRQLLSKQQLLKKLQGEEENLAIELNRLQQLAREELDLAGLDKLQHKLAWPIKGRLLKSFGNRKQGYLRWKGVLISAPIGREIKTIHNGKVLFSDWLNGYGLVIVIDHGNGYMSLYGHNQALLKNVGDRVETGEPIALVGQSGGQTRSALYFEVRHDGKTVNPKLWCQ